MSEYYAGGTNVPSGTGSIPTSGEIQLAADFYGTAASTVALNATITIGTVNQKISSTDRYGFLSSQNVQENTSNYGSINNSTFTATGSSNTVTIVQAYFADSTTNANFVDSWKFTFTGIAGDVYSHPHPIFSHILIGNHQLNYSSFSIAFNTNGFTNFSINLPNNSQTNYMGTSGTQTIQIVL
jgi:hypothetical protein